MLVALRLECVDRNNHDYTSVQADTKSHSVWSAWIEIMIDTVFKPKISVALRLECVDRNASRPLYALQPLVALRLECVDRNRSSKKLLILSIWSHSVWSAWIEMATNCRRLKKIMVALRLECVDRN